MSTIENAKNTPLNQKAGMVPQMQGAIQNYYQPMTFIKIGKAVKGGFIVENGDPVNFRGAMVPYQPNALEQQKYGERKWIWWELFCTPELKLFPDDVAAYLSDQYRCMAVQPFDLNNFRVYKLVQDYNNTITNLVYDEEGKLVDDGNQEAPAETVVNAE